jgi:hypothetical protein
MSKTKQTTLILLAIAGVLILLLAMSLPRLTLFQGEAFSLGQPPPGLSQGNAPLESSDVLVWVVRGFVALALICLPVYIISSLMSPQGRRRLIANVVMMALLLSLADYLRNQPLENTKQDQEQTAGALQPVEGEAGPPTAIFSPDPPAWLTLAIILTASVLVVAAVVITIWMIRRRRQVPVSALDRLAEAAQNTAASLQAGADFKVSVMRCYQEMVLVVKQEKGIARETAMTAREFEDQLVKRGLPQEAIRTLTRLFEQVRYGSALPSTRDEDLALSCLTDIVQACGGQREAR